MKQGMASLTQLAAELERQQNAKRDFIAPARNVSMVTMRNTEASGSSESMLHLQGMDMAPVVGDTAHGQIADDLGIPTKYYDRLRAGFPDLLDANVNTLLSSPNNSARRMVRTMDGKARAWLSDAYRPLDNFQLAHAALPTFGEYGDRLKFASMEITERRMYIKVVTDDLTAEVRTAKHGDVLRGGLIIQNSEIGYGMLGVYPYTEVLACTNGAVHTKFGLGKRHVGRRAAGMDEFENAYEFFTDATRKADDEAFFLKVRDLIRASLSEAVFQKVVVAMQAAAGNVMTGSIETGIEVVAKKFTLTEGERGGVLRHLIEGGDLTQWGLHNAITRTAQDAPQYDRATELEAIGGELLVLPARDWRDIGEAKAA